MSKSRREFLKLAGVAGLASPLLAPSELSACCFGGRRDGRLLLRSQPEIHITSPESGSILGRTFTAFGWFSFGTQFKGEVDWIKSKLYKVGGYSRDADSVTWTTQPNTSLTWSADYDLKTNEWHDGDNELILEVKMKLVGSDLTYGDEANTLRVLGVNQPPPIDVGNPIGGFANDSEIPDKPPTGGGAARYSWGWPTVQSFYDYEGRSLGKLESADVYFDFNDGKWKWRSNHDLSNYHGYKGISLVVMAENTFWGWKYIASRIKLKTKP